MQPADVLLPTDQRRAHILVRLRELAEAMDALQDAWADAAGVHRTDLDAVTHLADADAPLSMRQLADRLERSPGAVTAVVDRLERLGHVARVPDPGDRRRTNVELTPTARQVGGQFFADLAGRLLAVLEPYDDDDLAVVERFLDELPRALDPARRAGAD